MKGIELKTCPDCAKKARQERIRQLNDNLRCKARGGKVMVTQGITQLAKGTLPKIVNAIGAFNDFTEANDPYGEHDYGTVTVEGIKVYWKIDYYDRQLQYGSPDAANPDVTTRVMTIYLPSEH